MHQPRPLAVRVAHDFQHAVEVPRGAGAALHRKPHRLVEHQHIGIFVERNRFEKVGGLLVGLIAHRPRLGRIEPQRRNAHRLPGLQPVLRLGALAVDAHLAFADDALDVREAQARKPRLEKAIDPHAVLVGRDGDVLDACGQLRRGDGRRHDCFSFPVILRWPAKPALEGCTAPAVAPPEIGITRFRISKCQVGGSRLVGSLRSHLRVTVARTRAGLAYCLARLAVSTAARRPLRGPELTLLVARLVPLGPAICRPPPGWRGPRLPLTIHSVPAAASPNSPAAF